MATNGNAGPSKTVTKGAMSWGYASNERQSPRFIAGPGQSVVSGTPPGGALCE